MDPELAGNHLSFGLRHHPLLTHTLNACPNQFNTVHGIIVIDPLQGFSELRLEDRHGRHELSTASGTTPCTPRPATRTRLLGPTAWCCQGATLRAAGR